MTSKNKKLLLLSTAFAVALPLSAAIATTTNMNATANFAGTAITLTPTTMDFSNVTFSNLNVAGGLVNLGTDNSVTYDGVIFAAGVGAAPAAGTVTVNTGTVGLTVEVRCDATATLANATDTINATAIEVHNGAGTASGASPDCLGIAGAAATTLVLDGTDVFRFGAVLNGNTASDATFSTGAYSTANVGGNDVEVEVLYQ